MSRQYVCVRKNYCMSKLWKPGDKIPKGVNLPEGAIERGHFVLEGQEPDEPVEEKISVPGDDPRSNKEIRRILKEEYGVEPVSKVRKEIWTQLRDLEADPKAKKTVPGEPDEKPDDDDRSDPVWKDPKAPIFISKLTPDELDKTTKAKLAMALKDQYQIVVNHTAHTKDQLVGRLVQEEANAGGPVE